MLWLFLVLISITNIIFEIWMLVTQSLTRKTLPLLGFDWSLIETPCTLARWSDIKLDFSLTLHSIHSKISCSLLHCLWAFQSFGVGNIRLQAEHVIDFIFSFHVDEIADVLVILAWLLGLEFLWKYWRWDISMYRFANERKHFEHLKRVNFSFLIFVIFTFEGITA